MDTRSPKSTDSAQVPNRSTASMSPYQNIRIFATIADTTWRIFVPTLGLLGVGIWVAASTHHDKALGALIGVIAGAVLGYLLVFQQYRKVKSGASR